MSRLRAKDMDVERQYVVDYIVNSGAGFYVFDTQITSAWIPWLGSRVDRRMASSLRARMRAWGASYVSLCEDRSRCLYMCMAHVFLCCVRAQKQANVDMLGNVHQGCTDIFEWMVIS